MKTRDEQREEELARGRAMASRAERLALIERYGLAKKLKIMIALPGHTFYRAEGDVYMQLFFVDEVMVAHANRNDPDYPSDALMATLALAIDAAAGGVRDLPPLPPTHHVSKEAKEYNQRLAEINRERFGG